MCDSRKTYEKLKLSVREVATGRTLLELPNERKQSWKDFPISGLEMKVHSEGTHNMQKNLIRVLGY